MIRSNIMLCAESVIRDAESNNISVFNILEQINGVGYPLFIHKFSILVFSERDQTDPNRIDARITLRIGTTIIFDAPISIDYQTKFKSRSIITIQGLAIPAPGRLIIECFIGETLLNSFEVDTVLTSTPTIVPQNQPQ